MRKLRISLAFTIIMALVLVGAVFAQSSPPGSGWWSGEQIQNVGTGTANVQVTDSSGNWGTCSTTVVVQTGSTSTLSCTAVISPSPSYAGNWVDAHANISGNATSWEKVDWIYFPDNQGITGTFTGNTTAKLLFTYRGTFPIVMHVIDGAGNEAQCMKYHTVY